MRLDEVVLRALEREPDRRYQPAGQVGNDVDRIGEAPRPRAVAPAAVGERPWGMDEPTFAVLLHLSQFTSSSSRSPDSSCRSAIKKKVFFFVLAQYV